MALTRLGTNAIITVPSSAITALPAGVGGKVLQVVTARDSTERSTSSSSFVTASNTLSVTITPSSTSNKIFVIATLNVLTPSGTYAMYLTIYRNSTNLGDSQFGMGRHLDGSNLNLGNTAMTYLDSPSSTSALTYQVYFYTQSGGGLSSIINKDGSVGSITAFEIAG